MHPFICAMPACFCLSLHVPLLLLCLSVSLLLFFLSTEQRRVDMRARLHGHKGTSLWCFWSAARSDMSTASPPCTLQWLIMQHSAGTDNQRCTSPHVLAVNHTSMGTHTMQGPVVHVLALLTLGCLVCWTQGSESEMVCVISPFLPFFFFFFAFDSKMDDCNHRSHQWDRVEVYGAVRHSHGKPAFRLMQRAAMGTLCCLFVEGFCCFICIFFSPPPLPPVWPFDKQNMKASL